MAGREWSGKYILMLMNKSRSSRSIAKPAQQLNRWGLSLLFLAGCAIIGGYVLFQAGAAPKNRPPVTASVVTLSAEAASQKVQVGEIVPITIRVNTNGRTVNAVQANVTYPIDKFEFIGVDGAGSAFSIDAQAITENGVIKIARASITEVNSTSAEVAKINLRAIAAGRKVPVGFAADSMIVDSVNNSDVLEKTLDTQLFIQ
jgi:Cohesin domain